MHTNAETDPGLGLIVDLAKHPLTDDNYRAACRRTLDENGVLVLHDFLSPETIEAIRGEGRENQHLAYYTAGEHSVYLAPSDTAFDQEHPVNRQVTSSKGCITTDQIPPQSLLRIIYNDKLFKNFLCTVLQEDALYEYADPLSSINLHYAAEGQELGWHYDNSSFAITLLIQKPRAGAEFQYVKDARDADGGDMAFELTGRILDGEIPVTKLSMNEGSLILFRGRNSIHRVTPTEGDEIRMLVVLAYNSKPDVSLSESARMTFFGRLG